MSSSPGWYPDPGGQPGMFRYWDGSSWSAALSPIAEAPPPSVALGSTPARSQAPIQRRHPAGDKAVAGTGRDRGVGRGAIIAAAAIVVVLVVVVAFIVRGVSSGGLLTGAESGSRGEQGVTCPDLDLSPATEVPTRNGRVYGGLLSYPQLPAPWGPPHEENRIPFGFNGSSQDILVDGYDVNGQRYGWVASVMIGELRAGDGFFSPEAGSEIVTTCIVGGFYGDAKVTRKDRVSRAVQVDGHDGWLLETDLSFKIPGLKTDEEWLAVLIVDTGDGRSSIFSASIPNTSPQYEQAARDAMAGLRVGQ